MKRFFFCCFVLALLLPAGCGSQPAVGLDGKVVLPAYVELEKSDAVQITLMPQDEKGKAFHVEATASDLTFNLEKISPGTYLVVIEFEPYPGLRDSEDRADAFAYLNDNYSPETTPLQLEVASEPDQQSVVIDLSNDEVRRGST